MGAQFIYPSFQQTAIERRYLLDKLQNAIHHLTLIIAPAGYGKTTLAAQLIRETNIPSVWQTLERQDQDLPILFEHALSALSQFVPEISTINSIAGATAGELAGMTTEYLRNNTKTDFFYIIDDIHQLLEAANARAWLNIFIATLPSTCHLVLIGESLPPLHINEWFTRGKVIYIGQKELSFSLEELKQLATRVEVNLPDVQIEKIFSRLSGWPAGSLLALQPLPADIEQSLFAGKTGSEAIFETLADRLFNAQTPFLQAFLLSSSSLSCMTPSICLHALHLNKPLEHLADALQRSLFITEIPGGMVYHSLFRNFLQERLRLQDPEQFKQHHADAGKWFESENNLDEAFEHYICANLLDSARAIADRSALPYYGQAKPETLLRWQSQLAETNTNVPKLLYACAMIYRDRYAYSLANKHIVEAEVGFKSKHDEIGLIQVRLLKATIDNQLGNYQTALEIAQAVMNSNSTPTNLYGFALAIAGTSYLHLGNLQYAVSHLEEALPLWRDTGDTPALVQLLMTLQSAYFLTGRYNDTEKCLQEVVAIRRALGSNIGMVMALNNLGYHYHLLGSYKESLSIFQEGIQIVSRFPENRSESYILWSMGDLQRDCGAFEQAADLYHRSLQLIGNNEPSLRAGILVSLSTLKRWEGSLDDAYKLALEARALAESYKLGLEKLKSELAIWAVQIQQGNSEVAITPLENLAKEWEKLQSLPRLFQTLGIGALAALLSAEPAIANQFLRKVVSTTDHLANLQPLIAEIIHNPLLKSHILSVANRYKILMQGIKRLEEAQIQVIPSVLHSEDDVTSDLTYSLRISTLGDVSIERDGIHIPLLSVKAAITREIFFYLLIKGPSSREELGLIFWPESSPQQIRKSFHTALGRIRKGLGSNIISFRNELYSINPDIDVWCDVLAFENVVQQAKLTAPLTSHAEILWHQATKLYKGDFLSVFDSDWVRNYQEFLQQTYINVLLSLGNCLRLRGKVQEAIDIYKRAVQEDPFREDVRRSLITCFADLGEQKLIVQQIHELTVLLKDEMGVSPSSDTLALAQSLLN